VGALILRSNARLRRREILLVERAGNPLKGYWSLPGGLVETGETLEAAVKRRAGSLFNRSRLAIGNEG
jgi:ADP-ribose pyrophosphatase YjhB (NUDIX family)